MSVISDTQPKNAYDSARRELIRVLLAGPFPQVRKIDPATLSMKVGFLMPLIAVFARCCWAELEQGNLEEAHQLLERHARTFAEALNIPLEESHMIFFCLLVHDRPIKYFHPFCKLMDMTVDEAGRRQWFQNIWETWDSSVQNIP